MEPGHGRRRADASPVPPDVDEELVPLVRSSIPAIEPDAPPFVPHVMIVDDDEVSVLVATELLERAGLRITSVTSAEDCLAFFDEHGVTVDVLVSDVHMPGLDGFDLLGRVKALDENLSVVLMTGANAHELIIRALDLGAAGYIPKPFVDADAIVRRVNAAVRTTRLSRENARLLREVHETNERLRVLNDELHKLATTDGLTALYNRRYVDQVLERQVARRARCHLPLSVILLDVDRFKSINDDHGHAIGDEVLRRVGVLLRSIVRDGDCIGRWGGEEFVVVLPDTDPVDAAGLAERLRTALAGDDECVCAGGTPLRVTASFGVCGAPASASPVTARELICGADAAMYEAKSSGRDAVASRAPCLPPLPSARAA